MPRDSKALRSIDALDLALEPVAKQIGVDYDSAGDARLVPEINLKWSVGKQMAREMGQYLCRCGIYRQGRRLVTVAPDTGEVEEMKPDRFTSWCEQFVSTVKYTESGPVEMTMADSQARKILSSDQFRSTLWPLKGVHPVRLPVLRPSGRPELLSPGYDDESGIYTVDGVDYPKSMSIEESRDVLKRYLQDFPWGDMGSGPGAIFHNRSAGVQVAAMIGVFCRGMFPPGTKRPMIAYLANQPGTGKSLLAVLALAPVFGHVATTGKPRDEEKFSTVLETVAQAFQPYMFIDDIGGGIFSNALNRFLTSSNHTGRVFHSNSEMFTVPNVTQVFTTGNGIELTPDLQRRSLIVDMFLAGEVRGREFDFRLTESYLATEASRSELLGALWAIVREWDAKDRFISPNALESFEEWTSIIGGMTRLAGFSDPLEIPDLPDGGDKKGKVWRLFLSHLAGEEILPGETSREFTVPECLDKANEMEAKNLLDLGDLIGDPKDPRKAFGKRLQKWRGRHIVDTQGRTVEFGQRRSGRARAYECKVISTPSPDAPADPF